MNNLVDFVTVTVVMGSNTGVRPRFGHIQASRVISCHLNDPYANGWIRPGGFYQFQNIPDFRRGAHRTFSRAYTSADDEFSAFSAGFLVCAGLCTRADRPWVILVKESTRTVRVISLYSITDKGIIFLIEQIIGFKILRNLKKMPIR